MTNEGGSGGRRTARLAAIGLAAVLLLSGCVSSRGLPELQVYQAGFQSLDAATEVVLSNLETAERTSAIRQIRAGVSPVGVARENREQLRALGGLDETFRVEDAVYFAPNTTAPGTAAFRRALATVNQFNDVVAVYAQGRALSELRDEFIGLGRSLGQTGALLGVSSTIAEGVLQGALPGVQAAQALVERALEAGSREAFRQAIVGMQPHIDALLLAMRDTAPTIFRIITSDDRTEAKDAHEEGDKAAFEKARARVEATRAALSSWVIAIDRSRQALADVVAAVRAPATPTSLLADVAANAGALEMLARQTVVGLQAADAPTALP